jgi:hypothetical protein
MNAINTSKNPYVYNTESIPECHWFYTGTIVLKQSASEDGFRKMKNKEVVKWLHQTCKSLFGPEKIVPYKLWFATCCSEIQKDSGMLHFHLLFGNLFNETITESRPDVVNGKRKATADIIQNLILTTPFLGQTSLYYSVLIQPYIPKSQCRGDWIGYKFKKEQNPYWSDYYQRIVTLKNKTDSDDGVIPQILLDLHFRFPPKRIKLHNEAVDSGYGDTTTE